MSSKNATFSPPGPAEFAAAEALLAPWRMLTDPRFHGYGNLPADGRYLLVGNHTTLGLFDVPFLVFGIHRHTGVLVRSLGERQHFRVPMWRDLLAHFGTIDGTRENTRRLLAAGEAVLVFPGAGARSPAITVITIRWLGGSGLASRACHRLDHRADRLAVCLLDPAVGEERERARLRLHRRHARLRPERSPRPIFSTWERRCGGHLLEPFEPGRSDHDKGEEKTQGDEHQTSANERESFHGQYVSSETHGA